MLYKMKLVFSADAGLKSVDDMLDHLGFGEKPVARNALELSMEQTVPFIPTKEHIQAYEKAILDSYKDKTTALKAVRFVRYDYIEPIPDGSLTQMRAVQIAFQALQLIRKLETQKGRDWKDVDDWLFSELDLEIGELEQIYNYYNVMVYGSSCYEDGQSPKDYDVRHFGGRPAGKE